MRARRSVLPRLCPAAHRFPDLVLLAAGRSRRLGRPKALVRRGGQPLLIQQLQMARAAGFRRVHVILGADAPRLSAAIDAGARAALGFESLRLLRVRAWREGMGGSLREALHRLPPGESAVVLMLLDQVGLSAGNLRRLATAWPRGGHCMVAASPPDQRWPQVPVRLPRTLFATAERHLVGDRGLAAWLQGLAPHRLQLVPMAGLDRDLDTPQQASHWRHAPAWQIRRQF